MGRVVGAEGARCLSMQALLLLGLAIFVSGVVMVVYDLSLPYAGFEVAGTIPGGVTLRGAWPEVWRANLSLRGATRVLVRLAEFRAMHLAQLDKRARKLPWGDWLRPDLPVRVEATCRKSRIYHNKAAAKREAKPAQPASPAQQAAAPPSPQPATPAQPAAAVAAAPREYSDEECAAISERVLEERTRSLVFSTSFRIRKPGGRG